MAVLGVPQTKHCWCHVSIRNTTNILQNVVNEYMHKVSLHSGQKSLSWTIVRTVTMRLLVGHILLYYNETCDCKCTHANESWCKVSELKPEICECKVNAGWGHVMSHWNDSCVLQININMFIKILNYQLSRIHADQFTAEEQKEDWKKKVSENEVSQISLWDIWPFPLTNQLLASIRLLICTHCGVRFTQNKSAIYTSIAQQ